MVSIHKGPQRWVCWKQQSETEQPSQARNLNFGKGTLIEEVNLISGWIVAKNVKIQQINNWCNTEHGLY